MHPFLPSTSSKLLTSPTTSPNSQTTPPIPKNYPQNMEKRVLTSLTDPFDMSLSAHLMLSTPLFRAVPVPSSWPEQRTLPRGAGAGMQGTGESEKAETSASEPVVDGALEAITEASSVNGGEITT